MHWYGKLIHQPAGRWKKLRQQTPYSCDHAFRAVTLTRAVCSVSVYGLQFAFHLRPVLLALQSMMRWLRKDQQVSWCKVLSLLQRSLAPTLQLDRL